MGGSSYLLKRGDGYAFVIAVPKALRGQFKSSTGKPLSRIVKGLGTDSPKAAELAGPLREHWREAFQRAALVCPSPWPRSKTRLLRASKAVTLTPKSSSFKRAKRWCHFVAAYRGARMGEVAMLTKADCQQRDGVPVIVFSEAEGGTLKSGITRVVPVHAELVREGWLDFVAGRPAGPLFYSVKGQGTSDDPTNPARPRFVKTRERLASFVRDLGVTDDELSPTHAWRHTFKMLAHRAGMTEKASDQITGHEQKTVARSYGMLTIPDLAAELAKFPRYEIL
jgi:integrase